MCFRRWRRYYSVFLWSALGRASGSIPLFLIASEAREEERNSISRLEPSIFRELATTAAENT
jgi:hypothetical protein